MSEQEDNGLTLEGLAQRLETLEQAEAQRLEAPEQAEADTDRRGEPASEFYGPASMGKEAYEGASEFVGPGADNLTLGGVAQRLAALERENASLRQEVAALRAGSGSRLLDAGAAVLGAMGAGPLAQRDIREARYSTVFDVVLCRALKATPNPSTGRDFAVRGIGKYGVGGDGDTGVWGTTFKDGYSGIYGDCAPGTKGYGVVGDGNCTGNAGVLGRNSDSGGTGVRGEGADTGVSASGTTGVSAEGDTCGVRARATRDGGFGVIGYAVGSGIGGHFAGSKAQLHFEKNPGVGAPVRPNISQLHTMGEIYMDSTGGLSVCTEDGIPGIWRSFTSTLVVPAGNPGAPGGFHYKGEIYIDSAEDLYICVATTNPTTPSGKWKKVTTTAV